MPDNSKLPCLPRLGGDNSSGFTAQIPNAVSSLALLGRELKLIGIQIIN